MLVAVDTIQTRSDAHVVFCSRTGTAFRLATCIGCCVVTLGPVPDRRLSGEKPNMQPHPEPPFSDGNRHRLAEQAPGPEISASTAMARYQANTIVTIYSRPYSQPARAWPISRPSSAAASSIGARLWNTWLWTIAPSNAAMEK